MEDAAFEENTNQVNSAKELKERIKQLYGASMISIVSHLKIQANKSQNAGLKNKKIGRMPDYYQPSKNLLGIKFSDYNSKSDNGSVRK